MFNLLSHCYEHQLQSPLLPKEAQEPPDRPCAHLPAHYGGRQAGRAGNEPERWVSSAGRAKGTKAAAKSLNSYLDHLQAKVYEAHRQLEGVQPLTAEGIKNRFLGKAERGRTLVEVFSEHNSKVAALVGDGFAPGTLERYATSLRHTQAFIKWRYGAEDMEVRNVDHAFVTDYEFYLRSVRKCSNNTAVKYIKNLGKIITSGGLSLSNHTPIFEYSVTA